NLGIEASTGDWIIFLDSDDLLAPNCLSLRLENIVGTDDDYVATVAGLFQTTVGDDDRLWNLPNLEEPVLRFLSGDPVWQTSSCLWRRDAFEKFGNWIPGLPMMQDSEFHARFLVLGAKG